MEVHGFFIYYYRLCGGADEKPVVMAHGTANMTFEGMKQILGLGKKMKLMFSILSI